MAYASPHGYAFLDSRLYVPEPWFEEAHRERREKCRFPVDLQFNTKTQLAADMYRDLRSEGVLPFKYVVADSVYGASPDFINAIEEQVGATYFVSVRSNTLAWLREPATETVPARSKGRLPGRRVIAQGEDKPRELAEIAKGINGFFWYRRKVSEGTKGPIEYEFTKRRITLCNDGLPQKTVWLIVRRTIGKKPDYSY